MKSCQAHVKGLFAQATKTAFPNVSHEPIIAPANPKFGDYQCNSAMTLFKTYGKDLGVDTPGAVGKKLMEHLPKSDMFESVSCAPAGFVTVKLSQAWISKQLRDALTNGIKYHDAPSKRVVVDFSSPNIAKEMHVGHLRSTIIGESMSRIFEFVGHEVHRLNHVGDWGTQFGMLIEHMKETYPDFQQNLPNISDLQGFYKAAKARFDADEDFKKRAQLSVVKLQSGDAFARTAWQLLCEISRREFQKIYDRLDIRLEERGESYYNDMIPGLVKELQTRGFVKTSEGAQCFFVRTNQVPLMAVKSDGGFGYDSTDLAGIYHRLCVMRADWVVYITDVGQQEHFWAIFDAADQAGWLTKGIQRVDHMGFGVVLGEDGKKFKTRSGDVVKLVDLLDEAKERALVEIKKRKAETQETQGEKEEGGDDSEPAIDEEKAAEAIGYAAVRYFDLRQNRVGDYAFSFDRMLDNKGNTAVYMMYAYARLCAISRKAKVDVKKIDPSKLKIEQPAERELALCLMRFPEVIELMLGDLHIHRLAEYMYELSGKFTDFYQNKACRVVGTPEQDSRLLLCEVTREMLAVCFQLLGIRPLTRI